MALVRASLCLALAACGFASVDGRFTQIAVERAAPADGEAPGGDGSVYQFAGKAGAPLCFTGTIDNRDGRARTDSFRVRQLASVDDPPIAESSASKVDVVKEHEVAQPGVIGTNQYVVGADGSVGQIVELGAVGYPVADVKICFDGVVSDKAQIIVLNRVPKADERSAPSYAAWKL